MKTLDTIIIIYQRESMRKCGGRSLCNFCPFLAHGVRYDKKYGDFSGGQFHHQRHAGTPLISKEESELILLHWHRPSQGAIQTGTE